MLSHTVQVIGNFPKQKDKQHHVIEQRALHATQAKLQKILRQADSSDGFRTIKTWRHIFPHMPYTRKPAENKMGKGKGNVEGFVAVCKKGQIILEWTTPPPNTSDLLLHQVYSECSVRLPLQVKLVRRPKFRPSVPLAVEDKMKEMKAKRQSGELKRTTLIPFRRFPNALEEYYVELSDEEKERMEKWFNPFGRDYRDSFRHFKMRNLRKMRWDRATTQQEKQL